MSSDREVIAKLGEDLIRYGTNIQHNTDNRDAVIRQAKSAIKVAERVLAILCPNRPRRPSW